MRAWKMAGGAVAVLAVAALAVAWTPSASAQQAPAAGQDNVQRERTIIRERGPVVLQAGGVRLGVSIRDITAEDVSKLKLPGQAGVWIERVDSGSAAEKGGVRAGDVVVSFDGEAVRSSAQFTRLVRETPPGRTVKMAVLRDGKRVELSVTPEAPPGERVRVWIDEEGLRGDIEKELERVRPDLDRLQRELRDLPRGPAPRLWWFGEEGGPDAFSMLAGRGRLGVTVQSLTPELAEFFGVKAGALVTTVSKDGPGAKAGLKAGDVITAIDGKDVSGPGELVEQLREKSGEVSVTVQRDRKPLTLKATIEKAEPPRQRIVTRGIPV